jgi:hypothetical protein
MFDGLRANESAELRATATTSERPSFVGRNVVDRSIWEAIQSRSMAMLPEEQDVDELEKQVRRTVDRALRDLREDADGFGFGRR